MVGDVGQSGALETNSAGHLSTSLDIFGHPHSLEFRSQATRIFPEDNES